MLMHRFLTAAGVATLLLVPPAMTAAQSTPARRSRPVPAVEPPSAPAPALKVVGGPHVLVLRADGSVIGWGRYRSGQLGEQPVATSRRRFGVAEPVVIPLPGKAVDIAVGEDASYALLDDGVVYAWGGNMHGELGLGTNALTARLSNGEVGVATPQRVPGLSDVVQIAATDHSAFAVLRDGSVRAWGSRDAGILGDGLVRARWGETVPDAPLPVVVPGATNVRQLSAAAQHVLALTTEGRVLAWGKNSVGQLGTGSREPSSIARAVEVHGLGDVVSVVAGREVSSVLKRDGTVWVWGSYGFGLFGIGERDGTVTATDGWSGVPQQVPGIRNAIPLSMGDVGRHALALLKDGTLRGWGNSDWGQVGAGVAGFYEWSPVTPKISGVTAVWAAGNNSFAVTRDGRFWIWGVELGGTGLLARNLKVPTPSPLP